MHGTHARHACTARVGLRRCDHTLSATFTLAQTNPQTAWHKAIIDRVRTVTHIAPPDEKGLIIDEPVVQEGVIAIPSPRTIGLCAGVTNAGFATTTEVYPDSPKATDEQCNLAQVAVIEAALDYIIEHGGHAAAVKSEL